MDERGRRIWAATEALALGRGGMLALSKATGLGRRTIQRGCTELKAKGRSTAVASVRRIRRSGAGRRPLTDIDPDLLDALGTMVEPTTRGDPMSPLRWTSKSTRHLAKALTKQGHPVSHTKVAQLMEHLDYSLQGLADDLHLTIHVCRFPPGTSKWNKIEHRMFNHITQNWRGRPLVSHEVMVNLIASTTTRQGLKIRARLDQRKYPTGIKVTDEQMNQLMKPADFHEKPSSVIF